MFFHRHKIRKDLKLTTWSSIVFSDGCEDTLFPWDNIRFSKSVLFFLLQDSRDYPETYYWNKCDEIVVYPWENILGIEVTSSRGKLVRSISQEKINLWLLKLTELALSLPYIKISRGHFVGMIDGKPLSERADYATERLRNKIETFSHRFNQFI